jgi:hypothetical protein
MSEFTIHIPRTSDRNIYSCIKKISAHSHQTPHKVNINLIGDIIFNDVNFENQIDSELNKILEINSKLINTLTVNIEKFIISFYRGGKTDPKSPVYDQIVINNQNSSISQSHKLFIISTITNDLKAFDPTNEPGSIISKDQQAQVDIHLNAVKQLEDLHSNLSEKITTDLFNESKKLTEQFLEKQNVLNTQIDDERKKIQEEVNEKNQILKDRIVELEKREKEIDLRDNTIVRRELKTSFLDQIQGRISNFKLTSYTRNLRLPIHILCGAIIPLTLYWSSQYMDMIFTILKSSSESVDNKYIVLQLSVKQFALMVLSASTIVFYIKWLNRWFEKHSKTEIHLLQLQLDFERANWVVETMLEWKKELKESAIPKELTKSITQNLFKTSIDDKDENLHPADQISNAILSSSGKIKLKAGNADLELTGKDIEKAQKKIN